MCYDNLLIVNDKICRKIEISIYLKESSMSYEIADRDDNKY